MPPYTPIKKENENSLFKKDLKYMDFHYVTFRYLNTTSLKEEEKTSLAMRIHGFMFPMKEVVLQYELKKSKQRPEIYTIIEKGLKETIRRAKISLAIKDNHNELFIGYWKYLANVYREDALLLKDHSLETCIQKFEQCVLTMKP